MSLSSLLFSNYRSRVLGLLLLHPEKSYHLREIARLTSTVPGTLTRELTKLEIEGVLSRTNVGNQVHYNANRNCPIFEELASILRKTSGLVDVLSEGLLPLANRIEAAFVFGSIASGNTREGSDIDLMVIGAVNFKNLVSRIHPLQESLGREINPKIYTPTEWQTLVRQDRAFVRDVLNKPKLFVIGSENDVMPVKELK